jgi:hypothetical protein
LSWLQPITTAVSVPEAAFDGESGILARRNDVAALARLINQAGQS